MVHTAVIRTIDDVAYYNCGDWVESTSALVEDFEGKIELVVNYERTIEPAALLADVEDFREPADPPPTPVSPIEL